MRPYVSRAESTKELVTKWINSEEDFFGEVTMKTIDFDPRVVEIKITNHYTGDDSIGDIEYLITAKVNNTDGTRTRWEVISSKYHWKCGRGLSLDFWTTRACI